MQQLVLMCLQFKPSISQHLRHFIHRPQKLGHDCALTPSRLIGMRRGGGDTASAVQSSWGGMCIQKRCTPECVRFNSRLSSEVRPVLPKSQRCDLQPNTRARLRLPEAR